ncbi:ATP-binding protein [Myxococcus sp. RHSTA-1-4]|uniref:hybrid sensor histidine kinase/response regulator n=1 Tax=Myxococcus sp. RHSTA-1-4 TaxID=2874601 RepID=UPI001CBDC1DD|nr:ATP-binding protein [Myxococcus sp. RHSTA-1-4]MBZ4417528.1 PAS domain S-box protein [Myxococcus sp. RHSTA-1-4]
MLIEQWAHRFFELSTEPFVVMDSDGRILQANAAWSSLVDWPLDSLRHQNYRGFVHPEDVGTMEAHLRGLVGKNGRADFSCRWRGQDGTWRALSWSVASGVEDPLYCTVRPHEPPPSVEQALLRSEQNFRRLIDTAPEGIFVHRHQRFIYVNPTVLKALGYEHASELLGQPIWSIVHPDDLELVRQRVHTAVGGELAPLREIRYLRRDGTWYDAESVGIPVEFDGEQAVVVMSRDVTERKRVQSQLLQNDRMVLAGTLAAGVGHEINNPLTYVMANLDSAMEAMSRLGDELSRCVPDGPGTVAWSTVLRETEGLLKEAQEGATRVRNIVRDLKFISRQDEERREPVDVREPLDFSINMASSALRARARLIKKYEPVPHIHADASRLGQVFLNLLVNAAQAIPEGNAEDHHITVWLRPAPSGGVAVDVSDSGAGMTPAVLARIFDPFFTTKPVGTGTGLGLSICHSLVRNLGGDITVRSQPGRGTTFTVTLPGMPESARATPSAPAAPAPRTGQRGQVLVIDDEPPVGRSLARIIGPQHQVKVVTSGEEALAALTSGTAWDAVFCDLMMPGITGMDVYERVRESAPDLSKRFIFITGGSYTARARQFLERVPNRQIEKPFDVELIHRFLGEVLGTPSGARDASQ